MNILMLVSCFNISCLTFKILREQRNASTFISMKQANEITNDQQLNSWIIQSKGNLIPLNMNICMSDHMIIVVCICDNCNFIQPKKRENQLINFCFVAGVHYFQLPSNKFLSEKYQRKNACPRSGKYYYFHFLQGVAQKYFF